MESLFDEDDARMLEYSGLISEITENQRKVSATLIKFPLRNPANIPPSTNTVVVPAYINSVEAYVYLGFNQATSLELFQRFTAPSSSTAPVTSFLNLAIEHISGFLYFISDRASWVETMSMIGIRRDLQALLIMGPQFQQYRRTGRLGPLLVNFVEKKMRGLERVQAMSRHRQGRSDLKYVYSL